jgi:hypothetical protein
MPMVFPEVSYKQQRPQRIELKLMIVVVMNTGRPTFVLSSGVWVGWVW